MPRIKIKGTDVELDGEWYSLKDEWTREGLKEIGLTLKEFARLTMKEKKETVLFLYELGHLE